MSQKHSGGRGQDARAVAAPAVAVGDLRLVAAAHDVKPGVFGLLVPAIGGDLQAEIGVDVRGQARTGRTRRRL
jgi:hypothetical protein